MAVDIGPKIGIEGEAQFRREIQETNQALKTMAAEGKAVASAFDDEADAEKKVAAQKDVLNRQIEAQKKKLELLEKGLRDATEMYGPADEKTQRWAQAVYEATAKLNGMEHELSDMDNAVADTADNMEAAGSAAQGWADVMKGQLLADAIKNGLSKMAGLVKDASKAMWDASKAGAAYADDLLTMATTTGMSTKNLQEYKYMADLIDVSLDTLTGSMSKLTSTMNKANKGNKDAVKTFEDLGVAITDNNGQLRDTEDVFNDVVSALGNIENETERDAKAMDIFGKSAKELNPLIEAGADKLRDLAKEANETGYVLSGDALDALGKQQDAMDRLDKKIEGVKNSFAVGLAPSMEEAYDKLGNVFDNPKVRIALEDIAGAIGTVIEAAAWLVEKALPGVLDFFGLFDDRIRIFTDDQLELIQATEDLKKAHADMNAEYSSKAQAILDETARVQDLWQELQNLVGENGQVRKADEERVKYISGELNDALGTQLEMEGRILKGYKEQQKEIEKLIKKREADALLAAREQQAGELNEELKKAQQNAAQYKEKISEAWAEYIKKINEYNDAVKSLTNDERDEREAMEDAKKVLEDLQAEYKDAQAEYRDYLRQNDILERAREAAANENYLQVVRLLTDELGVTAEYYARKEELNEQDKQNLRDTIEEAKKEMAEYELALADGAQGASEAGLKKMQDYVADLQDILEGKMDNLRTVGSQTSKAYMSGLIDGLKDPGSLYRLEQASSQAAGRVDQAARRRLQIQSPSKAAAWIGKMWDEGLVRGLEASQKELEKAAASLAETVETSSTPSGDVAYGYGNAMTAVGSGYGAISNAYTTNLGGITVRIDGAGDVDADVLAQRVAVRLTDELRRAQRGGRA